MIVVGLHKRRKLFGCAFVGFYYCELVECYFCFVGGSFTYDYKLNFFSNQGLVDVLVCLICYEQLDVVLEKKCELIGEHVPTPKYWIVMKTIRYYLDIGQVETYVELELI